VTDTLEHEELTDREKDVISLLVRGWSTKQIAESLGITFTTAKTHLHNIHQKAGTTTRLKLVVWALKRAA